MKISQAYHRIQVILILTFTQLASLSNHDCASYLMNSLRMWPLCLRKRVTGVWVQNCLGTMLLILLTIPPLQRGAFLQCANGSLQKFIMQHIKILHSELVAMLLLLKHWSILLIPWRHCHYFVSVGSCYTSPWSTSIRLLRWWNAASSRLSSVIGLDRLPHF